jgi:hypothetical protein
MLSNPRAVGVALGGRAAGGVGNGHVSRGKGEDHHEFTHFSGCPLKKFGELSKASFADAARAPGAQAKKSSIRNASPGVFSFGL